MSKMAEHTPGPWTVGTGPDSCFVLARDPATGRPRRVCEVCCHNVSPGRMDANERLIAAAPTLLEAARLACAEMERITGDTGFEPERFREHMRLLWALSGAITRAERE